MTDGWKVRIARWRQTRYGFVLFVLLSFLAVHSLLRLVLFASFRSENPVPFGELAGAFLIGSFMDLFTGLVICLLLAAWMALVPNRWFGSLAHKIWFGFWLTLLAGLQVFLLAAEFFFFEEFKSRFNTVAVDYLIYPHEVFINIWDEYPVAWVMVVAAGMAVGWFWAAARLCRGMWREGVPFRQRLAWLAGFAVLVAALWPVAGQRLTRYSQERLLNELANNGWFSFVSAFFTRELEYAAFYRTIPGDEAYARARRLLAEPHTEFTESGRSIRRRVEGGAARPRLNVVILLEESLGSEFFGCLGRKGPSLTPEMDGLAADQGLLFTNLYASGNRTVRGFEGVLSGFPPMPGDSIVGRTRSQNVETIARVLKRDGYSTLFVYGGRGLFDNMRAFTLANGYDRFVEQKDFPNPTFATIWGVCNEDLYRRGIEECRAFQAAGKPFLVTLLSVSNHKPYTYPAGRIPEDPSQRRRENAVKYTDWALGQFFRDIRRESFHTNTVFVMVADHGARVYGSQTIPIQSYEIPMIIVGPAVVKQPARLGILGSSLDVAPTILGLVGRPYETLFFGRDLLRLPPGGGRALIHHNREVGIYQRDRLVTLGLNKTATYYHGDPKKSGLSPVAAPGPQDTETEKDAIALFQTADELYLQERYRLDP